MVQARMLWMSTCLWLGASSIRLAVENMMLVEDATEDPAQPDLTAAPAPPPTPDMNAAPTPPPTLAPLSSDPLERFLQRMTRDPSAVFFTLHAGITGVKRSVGYFNETPSDYTEGFATIKYSVWNIVKYLAEDSFKESEEYAEAERRWVAGMTEAPAVVKAAVDKFKADGDLLAFREVVDWAATTAEETATAAMPALKSVFKAYGDLLRGVGAAWVHYANGETESAIETIWVAFNTSIVDMVGAERASEESFKSTMRQLDEVCTSLLKQLVAFKQAKLESSICWRTTEARASRQPTVCEGDWDWNGGGTCLPKPSNGADCGRRCEPVNAPCPSFCPAEKSWCCRAGDPDSAEECIGANYVNHSFTAGTAEDYFQCVAPTSPTVPVEEPTSLVGPVEEPTSPVSPVEDGAGAALVHTSALQRGGAQRRAAKWMCHWFPWMCSQSVRRRTDDSGDLFGSHPALCNESSEFTMRFYGLCYTGCKAGWSIKLDEDGNETTMCQHDCHDPFGKEGLFGQPPMTWNVCTNSTAALDQANWDVLHVTKNSIGALQVAVEAIENRDSGMDTSLLINTIKAFGELAAHFNRPACSW